MTTSTPGEHDHSARPVPGFAVWLTGRPASGKSTVAAALVDALKQRSIDAARLESDALRRVLTPNPTYSDQERETFYNAMVHIGSLLSAHGVPVIFDATAPRRAYRDAARRAIETFIEVYVETPLETCRQRDPKGIYERAGRDESDRVPGLGGVYEPPERPELTVRGEAEPPEAAAERIIRELERRGWLPAGPSDAAAG